MSAFATVITRILVAGLLVVTSLSCGRNDPINDDSCLVPVVVRPVYRDLGVGDTAHAAAVRVCTLGPEPPFTWSTEPPGVATVTPLSDTSAVITGVAAGTTHVQMSGAAPPALPGIIGGVRVIVR